MMFRSVERRVPHTRCRLGGAEPLFWHASPGRWACL